ncbi:MAG: hypothetical protein WCI73_05575 [Phycisphaerae bacterium]
MTDEESKMKVLNYISRTVKQEWIQHLCTDQSSVSSRLYYIASLFSFTVTVLSGAVNQAEVLVLHADEGSSFVKRMPIGIFPLEPKRTQAFIRQLETYDVWNLADCDANMKDGLLCYHVIANAERDFCIKMSSPECASDVAYREIVNLYSKEFLNGMINLVYSPPPPWVDILSKLSHK